MENHPSSPPQVHRAEIDTARPFQSVKEAVAIFGERILVAQKPNATVSSSPSPLVVVASSASASHSYASTSLHFKQVNEQEDRLETTLQKLEAEIEETKRELKILKERESETEIALASLNAELHKNMSKMAEAEAEAAAAARAKGAEEKKKEGGVPFHRSPTLAQILKLGEEEGYFGLTKKQRKMMKKKPIIPLIGDLFSKKKNSANTVYNPLFNSSQALVN